MPVSETTTATIGDSGIVGVLQSLLQCYRNFLTAHDFGDELAILQLRAALLENSTTAWAIAVGIIDEQEYPQNKFLVARPTENNARLAKETLASVCEQLNLANEELTRRLKQGPTDKTRLENALNKATTLVDRLVTDFAPVEQNQQLEVFCERIKELKLREGDLKELQKRKIDQFSHRALKSLEDKRAAGSRFININVTKDATVNIGDYYDKDWKYDGVRRQQGHSDTYEVISVTDKAFVNIGDSFGGNHPVWTRLEQMQAARSKGPKNGGLND
ncbi:hypothetical protein TWF696_004622 [Orbilia brochopaga]|uniref:Prion-inhibition and propagation HeLo domain-containing protein n=1 Tax=Orbilia brochopaga TaxID=3140254 RepID=A0AAV9V8I4_9PEZI